jgi:transcription termination factor Rho
VTSTRSAVDAWLPLPAAALLAAAAAAKLTVAPNLDRAELLAALLQHRLDQGDALAVEGVLEVLPEGFGFLRYPAHDFAAGAADVYLSPSQVRGLNLKPGHAVRGPVRGPKGKERFFALLHVDAVGGQPPAAASGLVTFAARTPIVPTRSLPIGGGTALATLLTALCPWQRGHRVLLSTPAEFDATTLLTTLAAGIAAAPAPPIVTACLLDQRPDDVARARAMLASANATAVQLLATLFDAPAERHVAVTELALAQAERQVEAGADVVLLFASLTSLTQAAQQTEEPSGRWLCPGLDAKALGIGRRLFAAARACAEGGSLTVIATATSGGSAFEQTVLAEFQRRGNGEIVVDPMLVASGASLPFDLRRTGTRPEDDARPAAERAATAALRTRLSATAAAQWPEAVRAPI